MPALLGRLSVFLYIGPDRQYNLYLPGWLCAGWVGHWANLHGMSCWHHLSKRGDSYLYGVRREYVRQQFLGGDGLHCVHYPFDDEGRGH